MLLILLFCFLLQINGASQPALAAPYTSSSANNYVSAKLIANTKAIIPGIPFRLGVQLQMQPGWHTYYKYPGDAGVPTKIIWHLPTGFRNTALLWEKPSKFSEAGITTYGYENRTTIATKIIPPANLEANKEFDFAAQIEWLSCNNICLPGKATAHLRLPIASQSAKPEQYANNTDTFAAVNFDGPIDSIASSPSQETNLSSTKQNLITPAQLGIYFVFAFLGGFLLNFMPCVLPVVAIKILSLLEQANQEKTRLTAIAFCAGVLSSFLALGLLIVGLQTAGSNIGWGFQFQQPIFLMLMSTLILFFALSLFGLFDLSVPISQEVMNKLGGQEGILGDYLKGVLATILSTPCTAPFLGTALGFAFVQPWFTSLPVFLVIGLGMCLPYLILIIAPQYLRYLPKPGLWMEKLKEAFAFLLLATVAWLVSILSYQISINQVISFLYFLLLTAFATWLISRFSNLNQPIKRTILSLISLFTIICAAYFLVFKTDSINQTAHQPFSSSRLEQALSSGRTVFLDFTAKWCLTCQLNEQTVLNTEAVQNKFRSLNIIFMKADWTKQDPNITKLLRQFGRSGVPCYVIFPAKHPDKPIILPELLTQEIVLSKLEEAEQ